MSPPIESLDPAVKVQLEKIMREHSQLSSGERQESGLKDLPASSIEELLTSLENIEPEVRQKFLKTWLAARLPLESENLLPLLDFIQQEANPEVKAQIIEVAAFLQQNNIPLRNFFLKPLADLINYPQDILSGEEQDLNLTEGNLTEQVSVLTNNNNFTIAEIISKILFSLPQQEPRLAASLLQQIPNTANDLLAEIFQEISFSSSLTADEGSSEFSLRRENIQLQSFLLSLSFLNQVDRFNDNHLLRFYLEWPPVAWREEDKPAFSLRILEEEGSASQEQQESKTFKLSLLIALPESGNILANLLVKGKNIFPSFTVEKKETRQKIKDNLGSLKERLSRLDYQLKTTQVKEEKSIELSRLKREILTANIDQKDYRKSVKELLDNYHRLDYRA